MTARHDQYVVPGCDHDQILHPHQCYTSAVAVDEAILGVDSDYLAGMRIADFVTFAKRIEGIPASHIRPAHADGDDRSEEHTSDLQSLMRISYAVFCLKTKHAHYIRNTQDT